MSQIPIGYNVNIDVSNVKTAILNDTLAKIIPKFRLSVKRVIKKLQEVVREEIYKSPEYYDLLPPNGVLYHEIGNDTIENDIEVVIDTIVKGINKNKTVVEPHIVNGEIQASFNVNILDDDYRDLLALPEATYTYYSNRQDKEITIPWLSWLLLGSETIEGFRYKKIGVRWSRTNEGIMVEKGSWSLSQDFAEPNNNFLTRALEDVEQIAQDIMVKEFNYV